MSNDELLFKEDRPRPIDHYIDYFGTPEPIAAPAWLVRLLDHLDAGDFR